MVLPATSSSAAPTSSLACIGGAERAGAAAAAGGAPVITAAGSRFTLMRRSPSATSISVSSLSVSNCASSRTSEGSMRMLPPFAPLGGWAIPDVPLLNLALGLARARSLAEVRRRVQSDEIAQWAEAGDRAASDLGDHALPPEVLAGIDVRQVHLDHRGLQRGDGVADRDRRVGVASAVDDHGRCPGNRLVKPVDQFPLVVGLAHVDLQLERFCPLLEHRADLGERLVAVDARLAVAEQVQVRPVQN